MMWVDPANWTTNAQEVEDMEELAQHFEIPLQRSGFQSGQLKKEWNGLKTVYKFYAKGQTAATFWENTLKHR